MIAIMRKILFLLIILLGFNFSNAQSKDLLVEYDTTYSCVNYDKNKLKIYKGGRRNIIPFFRRLERIINGKNEKINIWHVGGSHVQAGTFSHRVRRDFALKVNKEKASRTILFPYKIASTNGPLDYSVSYSGSWSKSRCLESDPKYEMGLSGITVATSSPSASVTFSLSTSDSIDWRVRQLKVLGTASSSEVEPYIEVDGTTIRDYEGDSNNGYLFKLPRRSRSFTVKFEGLGGGNSFELRGVVALNDEPGVSYWASGVNGASTSSWLRCSLLEKDLDIVAPDMVIFGIGINDAHTTNFKRDKFKNNYQQLINMIKRVNPHCMFIFVTNNDNKLKGSINYNTPAVEDAFIELARENNGAVWNLFRVMGGSGSSRTWVRNGLMQKDHIHFTRDGYKLIGDLLYNSIMSEYLKWRKLTH